MWYLKKKAIENVDLKIKKVTMENLFSSQTVEILKKELNFGGVMIMVTRTFFFKKLLKV